MTLARLRTALERLLEVILIVLMITLTAVVVVAVVYWNPLDAAQPWWWPETKPGWWYLITWP